MKRIIITTFCFLFSLTLVGQSSFYDLEATTIEEKPFHFKQLKGKKVLIVNTASRCSLSGQLRTLQELEQQYADSGLVILAFPCNDFANREPGFPPQILEHYRDNLNITFTILQKTKIEGPEMDPVFEWLTQQEKNGVMDASVKWNFQKFLIDEKGNLIDAVDPIKKPNSKKIMTFIRG